MCVSVSVFTVGVNLVCKRRKQYYSIASYSCFTLPNSSILLLSKVVCYYWFVNI